MLPDLTCFSRAYNLFQLKTPPQYTQKLVFYNIFEKIAPCNPFHAMNTAVNREDLMIPITSQEILDTLNSSVFPKPSPANAPAVKKVMGLIRDTLSECDIRIDVLQPSFRPRSCRTMKNDARAIAVAENIVNGDEAENKAFDEIVANVGRIIGIRLTLSSLPGLEKLIAYLYEKFSVFKVDELAQEKDPELKAFAKAINSLLAQFGEKEWEQVVGRKCISDFLTKLCAKEVYLASPRAANALRQPQKTKEETAPRVLIAEFDEDSPLFEYDGETVALVRRRERNFGTLIDLYSGMHPEGIVAIAVIIEGKKRGRIFAVREIAVASKIINTKDKKPKATPCNRKLSEKQVIPLVIH